MSKPIRVLQIVHRMDRGGIETWLMNVLRNIDRERYIFDFMTYTTERCAYDDEIRSLGARILPCVPLSQPLHHLRAVQQIICREGPYDVVHAHGDLDIGVPLRAAAQAGVPVRIAHSHNAPASEHRRLRSHLIRPVMRRWMEQYMTHGLGCSEVACTYQFGADWKFNQHCRVLHYGLNWEAFERPADEHSIRAQLGLPQDALVIGHVGRFDPQKNHIFLLDVAQRVASLRPDAHFLLVGDGVLRSAIQEQARALGLDNRVIFAGVRPDIPKLLQAMDVFLFPSFFEGLPLAMLEAQAAGLPCVISDLISDETTVIEQQVRRLSLKASIDDWATTVLEMSKQARCTQHAYAWKTIAHSKFSIQHCLDELTGVYQGNYQSSRVGNEYTAR